MNLLDALKTSFSHRSLSARSIGKRDTISEAAVASISMLKVNKKNKIKYVIKKINWNINKYLFILICLIYFN